MKSFVSIRERFLKPGGVLIPQRLSMLAAPVMLRKSIDDVPVDPPISCSFLRSTRRNYSSALSISDRERVDFVGAPVKLTEVEFATVETAPSMQNLSALWKMDNLSLVNGIAVFNHHTFTDEIQMDSFTSQSWGATVYQFEPFPEESGELSLNITIDGAKSVWTVSAGTASGLKTQSFSPTVAVARLRMAQQMTPNKKCRSPEPQIL